VKKFAESGTVSKPRQLATGTNLVAVLSDDDNGTTNHNRRETPLDDE
jgi:hypothetical protein